MSVGIQGWVEVQPKGFEPARGETWLGVIRVTDLVDPSSDMFACLFGIQNFANFRPIAPARGFPPHLSPEAQHDVDESQFQGKPGYFGETWVSWAELAGIDWDERAEAPDSRVHQYTRDEHGRLRYTGKASYSRDLARELGLGIAEILAQPPVFAEGTEWDINGTIYRVETLTRRQTLAETRTWPVLFSLMRTLAERFGEDGVRLVVWFD